MATVSDCGGNGGPPPAPTPYAELNEPPVLTAAEPSPQGWGQQDDVGEGALDGGGEGTVDGVGEGAMDGVWGSGSHGWPWCQGSCSHGRGSFRFVLWLYSC
jgi:hypothetical protein